MPDIEEYPNGFRAQWEQFLRDVDAGRPHGYDLAAGVRGLQLVEAGLRSSQEGRRVVIGEVVGSMSVPVVRAERGCTLPHAERLAARGRAGARPRDWDDHPQPYETRVAFAAAHVVADPYAENVPGAPAAIDWDATLAFRAHLFRYGLGVAEAMDTAQRNMGLDWAATQELITRSAAQARAAGARIASGAGTDHLPAGPAASSR